ncbi:RecT family recombinase [Plesiomonas shigelloides]|uniref:RecT family recombinase n=1 Tax=Plesiomonas shigelloides TaxID=703 RepID=UPI001C498852
MMNQQVATPINNHSVIANDRGQANMLNLMMNADFMMSVDRMADIMASGKATVPNHLRGNKADCYAVCLQALQWGMNPFPVAQKTHLVNGTLGYEAQLVNAVVVNSGVIKGRFDYEFFGPWERVIGKFNVNKKQKNGENVEYRTPNWTFDDEKGCGVRVSAALNNGEVRTIELLLQQARTRNSTLWADDPKQQLAYLGVKRWARLYAPDVIMGVYSVDELQEEIDITPISGDDTPPSRQSVTERLAAQAARKRAAQQAARKGNVIEGEARSVAEKEATIDTTPAQNDSPKELSEQDIQDMLADILFRMDESQSNDELKPLAQEISAIGQFMSKEQQEHARAVYLRNMDRLGLRNKCA